LCQSAFQSSIFENNTAIPRIYFDFPNSHSAHAVVLETTYPTIAENPTIIGKSVYVTVSETVQGGEIVFDESHGCALNEAIIVRHDPDKTLHALATDFDARGRFRAQLDGDGNYFLVNIAEFMEYLGVNMSNYTNNNSAANYSATVSHFADFTTTSLSALSVEFTTASPSALTVNEYTAETTRTSNHVVDGLWNLNRAYALTLRNINNIPRINVVFAIDASESMSAEDIDNAVSIVENTIQTLIADPSVDFHFALVVVRGSWWSRMVFSLWRPGIVQARVDSMLNMIQNDSSSRPVVAAAVSLSPCAIIHPDAEYRHTVTLTNSSNFKRDRFPCNQSCTLTLCPRGNYQAVIGGYMSQGVMLNAVVPQNRFDDFTEIKRTRGDIFDLNNAGAGLVEHILNFTGIPAYITLKGGLRVQLDQYPNPHDLHTSTANDGIPDSAKLKFPPIDVNMRDFLVHYLPTGTHVPNTFVRMYDYNTFPHIPEEMSDNDELHWPMDSMEVTLWFGQLDTLSFTETGVESRGLNIQGTAHSTIRAVADGVVAGVTEDRLYIDFMRDGHRMQAEYGNISAHSRLTEGRRVRQGEIIGQMLEHRGRYVLEFILRDESNNEINPAPFFDLSGMTFDLDYLTRPMSNFFAGYLSAGNDIFGASVDMTCIHTRYAHNYDLDFGDGDNLYLRKLIDTIFISENFAEYGATINDVLQWNNDDRTITVIFPDETYLIIPEGMCNEEALYNHRRRHGFINNSAEETISAASIFIFVPDPTPTIEEYLSANIRNDRVVVKSNEGFTSSSLSLELIGSESERKALLNILNELSCDTLTMRRTGNLFTRKRNRIWVVDYTTSNNVQHELATTLVRAVINSMPYRTQVRALQPTDKRQDTHYNIIGTTIIEIVIDFNENINAILYKEPSTSAQPFTVHEPFPPYIIMGHELIHAFRYTRQIHVRSDSMQDNVFRLPEGVYETPDGNFVYTSQPQLLPQGSVLRSNEIMRIEEIIDELQTIGITYWVREEGVFWHPSSAMFTENALREERGLARRVTHYGVEIR
jgi:hypothetical protein